MTNEQSNSLLDVLREAMTRLSVQFGRPPDRIILSPATFEVFRAELREQCQYEASPGGVFMGAVVEIDMEWFEGKNDWSVVCDPLAGRVLH